MIGKPPVWNSVLRRQMARGHDLDLEARTRFGARMHVRFPDTIQSYVYFFGVREPSIAAYMIQALAPGDIVIDIGANVGYDTLLASHLVGPDGAVHAIEASPHVYGLPTENLALNETANVTPHLAAVCISVCTVPVYPHDARDLGGTTTMPAVARRRAAGAVDVRGFRAVGHPRPPRIAGGANNRPARQAIAKAARACFVRAPWRN